ncbi:hypothetical protein ACFX10_008052 [Malus domestica]
MHATLASQVLTIDGAGLGSLAALLSTSTWSTTNPWTSISPVEGKFLRRIIFTTVDITDEIYGHTTEEDDPSNSPVTMDSTIRY